VIAYERIRALGGKGANQAITAAGEGAHVVFVTAVGEDGDGGLARSELARFNVQLEVVAAPGDAPGRFRTWHKWLVRPPPRSGERIR
jgi:ribokinase